MATEIKVSTDFEKVSPTDAVKDLESKGLRVTATAEETAKAVQDRLFAITQSINMEVLQDTRDLLAKGLKNGLPYKDFQKQFLNMLSKKGWTGERIIKLPGGAQKLVTTTPARLSLIYDNAVSTSVNAGRMKRFIDNSADRPYLQLNEINDHRSRKTHKQKSGTIQLITASVWKSPNSWIAPNGHRCRGWMTALSAEQAKSRGIKVKHPGTVPDKGFGYNSSTSYYKPEKKNFDSDIWALGQKMKPSK